jgi:hypothetical protein
MPFSGLAHPSGRGARQASGLLFYLLFYFVCLLVAGLLVLILGLGSRSTG